MDGLLLFYPYNKDSLKGRHVHLSTQAGTRSLPSEDGAGATTSEPEHSVEGSEQEVEKEINEVEEGEYVKRVDEEGGKVKKAGNEKNNGTKREKQDNLAHEEESEKVEERQSGSKGREGQGLEEGFCVGKDEAKEVSESSDHSSETKGTEQNETNSNKGLERYFERKNNEGNNRKWKTESYKTEKNIVEENEGDKEAEESEIEDEVAEECVSSGKNCSGSEKLEKAEEMRGDTERILDDISQDDCEKEEVVENHKRGQEEEGEGESDGALQGCSISHRKLTETPEEVLERFVQSEGEETSKEGWEIEDESEGQAPPGASGSEEELVEVFKAGPSRGQKTLSSPPAEVGFSLTSVLPPVSASSCM